MQPSSLFNFPLTTGMQTTTQSAANQPITFDTLNSNQSPFVLPQVPTPKPISPILPTTPAPSPSAVAPQAPRPQVTQPTALPTPAATGQVTTPSGAIVDSKTGAIISQPPQAPTLPSVPTSTITSVAEQTASTLGQKIADIADRLGLRSSRKAELQQEAGVQTARANVQGLSDQINRLNAQNQADVRALEAQGRGIDQTILSRQGNEINRQYAIKALPLTAQLQAAQGSLAQANETVSEALDAEFGSYEAQLKALESAYNLNKDILTREDKKAAQTFELQLADYNRQLEDARFNRSEILKISTAAGAAQAPAEVLARITNAKTPEEAVQFAAPYLGIETAGKLATQALERQKLVAEISDINAKVAAKLAEGTTSSKDNEILSNLQIVNDVLANAGSISGIFQPGLVPFTPGSKTAAQYQQLKAILALDNRSKLKGSGAISDYESKTLNQASSALSRLTSQADFEKELKRVRGVFATAAGLTATVLVKDPKTGKEGTIEASRDGINQAIRDGLVVEYQ